MEGTHCFDAEHPQHPPYQCPRVAPNGDVLLPLQQGGELPRHLVAPLPQADAQPHVGEEIPDHRAVPCFGYRRKRPP
jgi:hypothetical protein